MSQTADTETGKPFEKRSTENDEIPPPAPAGTDKPNLRYVRERDELVFSRYGGPIRRDVMNQSLELHWRQGEDKIAGFRMRWFSRLIHYTEPAKLMLVNGELPCSKILRTIAKLEGVNLDLHSAEARNYRLIISCVGLLKVSRRDWEFACELHQTKSEKGPPTP